MPSRSTSRPGTAPAHRHARAAVGAVFFANAALYANVLPRFPELKDDLGLDNAALGSAVAAFALGALLAGLSAPAAIGRLHSANVASTGIALLAVAVLLLGLAPSWALLAAAFFVAGALDAVIDVAQNAQGLRLQRLYGRSIVNSFHGVWSIGAVAGGLLGSLAAGWGLPLVAHLGASAAVFGGLGLISRRHLLPGSDGVADDGSADLPAAGARLRRGLDAAGRARLGLLVALGAIAASGAVVEDAGATWGAVYLTGGLGAPAAAAGLAVVALQGAMTVGRLLGDRVVDRLGQRRVARGGAVLLVAGMGGALAVPTVATTIAGFAAAGLGVATLVPAAMHTADEIPGLRPGSGLTVVSWLLRVGFLASPPLVGLVADTVGLRAGLLAVPLAGVVVLALSPALSDHPAGG